MNLQSPPRRAAQNPRLAGAHAGREPWDATPGEPATGGCGIGQVRLLGGPFKRAQEQAGRHLLALPLDPLLDAWQGGATGAASDHPGDGAGQCLSACALMWAATGDPLFRRRAEHIVRRLSAWVRATGYAAVHRLGPLRTGLQDAHRHAGSELAQHLLGLLAPALDEDQDAPTAPTAPACGLDRAEHHLINAGVASPNGSGARLQDAARFGETIFAADGEVLGVAQYIAAELTWREKGLRVSQVTAFPERTAVRLIVGAERVTPLTLRLRHPWWCRAMTVRLNGRPLVESCVPGGWIDVGRRWCNGDVVDLELPMHLHLAPSHPGAAEAMLMYGPMVLVPADAAALEAGRTEPLPPMPRLALQGRTLEEAVRRQGSTLRFRAAVQGHDAALELLPCHQAAVAGGGTCFVRS